MDKVRLALPKGKILEESLELMGRLGIVPEEDPRVSRRLVIPTSREGLHLLVLRGWDVPTYVEYGAADAGIVGLDVLEEQGQDVYRPLDLGIGRCRMMVAEPRAMAGGDDPAACQLSIKTSARGFADTWRAVLGDFAAAHAAGGTMIAINDMGATPAVVMFRLAQALSEYRGGAR